MTKRFKGFNLSSIISSFQLCRSKDLSAARTPLPSSIYKLSPFNPKRLDVTFPHHYLSSPPPSTPHSNPSTKRLSRQNKQLLIGNSTFSSSVDGYSCSVDGEKENDEEGEETESLLFNSRSFSCDSSLVFSDSKEVVVEPVKDKGNDHVVKKIGGKHRLRKMSSSSLEIYSPMRASVLKKMVEGNRVKDSVAVVKKSEDPYEDFKRSMLEMILEKEIFEGKELEELLQCFLSLNSRQYHAVIVDAFSEIWKLLFCDDDQI